MSDFGAIWTPAPIGNFDYTRAPVDLIVDHHTASTLAAALNRFLLVGSQVSAHFIVDNDTVGTIYQCVLMSATAYHSGNYAVNQRSVGIEHVSIGPHGEVDYFSEGQYASSTRLHQEIGAHFGFPLDPAHVWPHHQVVPTDCPGLLDLSRLIGGGPLMALTDQQQQDLMNMVGAIWHDGHDAAYVQRFGANIADLVGQLTAEVAALTTKVDALKPGTPGGTVTVTGGSLTLGS